MTHPPRTPPPPPNVLDLSGDRADSRRGGRDGGTRGVAVWLVVVIAASCLGIGVVSGYMLGFVTGSQLFENFGDWDHTYVELDYVDVVIDAPDKVVRDTPFVVTLKVTNVDSVEHTLACVDLYFEDAEVISIDPVQIDMMFDDVGFKSYLYNKTIAPGDTVTTTITFKATATGENYLNIDACIDEESICVERYFTVDVTAE